MQVNTPLQISTDGPQQQVGNQDGLGRMALLTHPDAPEDPSLFLQEAIVSSVH